MRFVEITISPGRRTAILRALDDEGIDYVVIDEVSGEDVTAVVSFPLPTSAVEPVLEQLREAGLDEDAFTIVLDAETVVSRRFDRLQARYAEDEKSPERIAREEMRSRVRDLIPEIQTYTLLIVASVTIATAGVLLDSAAVVVGAMVIAPLIGPAMATSLGTVLEDHDLFVRGTRYQVIGAVIAVVTAAGFAWLIKTIHLVPPGLAVIEIGQVRERLAPDFLSLAVALGAGVAGAFSLSAGVSTALVGVMIAAALVPPIAVIGIGIAWGEPSMVISSAVLVLLNFISINLAALAVLWYQGYRPESWFQVASARVDTGRRLAGLVVAIALLSLFLGAVTVSSYYAAVSEEAIHEEVEAVVADHEDLTLIDMTIRSKGLLLEDGPFFFGQPDDVVVTVGRSTGTTTPDLAATIADRLADDGSVRVEVRFVEVQRSS